LKLFETGYRFGSDERARIYLTNALEPPQDFGDRLAFDAPALAHEAAAVNEIKRHKRFTVVIGNPPYSGISSNRSDEMLRIVDAYRMVDGAALTERKLWLQDDYVKFIRKAQTTIETTRVGILGYITNHGYLDNPTFRGMRQSLMGTFPRMSMLDLHGNAKKTPFAPDGSPDANVFDIQQGVSLALFSTPCSRPTSTRTSHSELWGSRESKYRFLDTNTSRSTTWSELHPAPEFYLLVPHDIESKDEYEEGWKVADIFLVNGTGVVTGRDSMTIDFDREQLWTRVTDFAKLSEAAARTNYELGTDARDWRVATAQADVRASGPTKSKLVPILYRPFDFRFTYYTGHSRGFYASPCAKVMQNMAGGQNMGLVWTRPMSPQFEFTVCVSRTVADQCSVGNKSAGAGISYLAPLRVSRGDVHEQGKLGLDGTTQPNFGQPFLKQLGSRLNLSRAGEHGLPAGLAPEDIFHYAYAVFHSPGYRSRYEEFLKIDFPRLPLTGNLELFRALARLGGELVSLHLLESPKLAQPITEFIGSRHPEVEKVSWSKNTVWLDKDQTTGFRGVRETVWDFHIGGYQVCQKWLKDRKGRTLSKDDIAHYHKIVIALSETIRLMAEIDKVIERHGGWPAAFQPAGA
nr:DNA methyltransferase [Chthoniobacterales bacterium]